MGRRPAKKTSNDTEGKYGFGVILDTLAILQRNRGRGVSFDDFRREQEIVRLRQVPADKGTKPKKVRQKAGVSRSTFERRMKAIQGWIPLRRIEDGRVVRWDIATEHDTPFENIPGYVVDYVTDLAGLARPGAINAREWQALRLAQARLNAENLHTFALNLKSLEAKLAFLLPPNVHRKISPDLETLTQGEAFVGRPGPREILDSNVLEELNRAVLESKVVEFDYVRRIRGGHVRWRVEPAGFAIGLRHYLLAFPADQAPGIRRTDLHPKSFAIANMSNVIITDEVFAARPCDVLKHIGSSFGAFFEKKPIKVTLRFAKERQRDVMTWHFHGSQKVRLLSDGDVEVKLNCRGQEELLSHLFSNWRSAVTIVSPAPLKDLYKKMLIEAAQSIGWTPG